MARTEIKTLERATRRGGGGRPTREEAEARDVRLLDVATHLFMERGFDGTSIDAVAEAAGISKPTVYARYHDKRDLFAAVLRKRIRDWLAPLSAAAEAELAKLANEEGWLRAVRGVSSILRQSAARGQIKVDDPELAADMFLNLVLGHSKRLALYSIATDPETEERHRKAAVEFFLNGIRTK